MSQYTLIDSVQHTVDMLQNKYKKKVIQTPFFADTLSDLSYNPHTDESYNSSSLISNGDDNILFFGVITTGNQLQEIVDDIREDDYTISLYLHKNFAKIDLDPNSQVIDLFHNISMNINGNSPKWGSDNFWRCYGSFRGYKLEITSQPLDSY